jgi:ABC-type nitrate/sulfonate/bicarbonate transport system ATPase subunit
MAFLDIIDASKVYGSRHVLDGINLSIDRGEFVSVVGYSGSGKTTLIGVASGLFAPTSGRVLIDRRPITSFAPRAAIVFQNYSLLPWFSALENVRLGVEAAFPDWSVRQQREQATKFLEMVGLGNSVDKKPSQLSGGMRQRVSIARAFAVEPEVLFLDEPFGALDALTRANLQQELKAMRSSVGAAVTTLMITNSVDEAMLLSDRIIPLSRGPKATLGPPIEIPHDVDEDLVRATVVDYLTGNVSTEEAKACYAL